MDFKEYQKQAQTTAVYPNVGKNYIYPSLGLCSEVGEFANKVKKILRDDNNAITPERRELLKAELGDVLWYVAIVAMEFGFDLEDVAQYNLDKLASRKERKTLHADGDER